MAGVFFAIADGQNTAIWSTPLSDVDGWWTTKPPGTAGACRKMKTSKTLTATTVTSAGKACKNNTFKGQFLIDGSPTWYLANRLQGSWKNAVNAGIKADCCTKDDLASVNLAITHTTNALGLFTAAQ